MAPSASKTWSLVKVYAAVKDLPEVMGLVGLLAGVGVMGTYTAYRTYFLFQGDNIPSKHLRHHWEEAVGLGEAALAPPSVYRRLADSRRDPDLGPDIAVWPFSNRAYPGDHEVVFKHKHQPGVPYEGPSPVEY